MTEKEIYKNGVALLEEWEDVNYCEHSFKFKDEWLTDKEVVDLLNELNDENEQLKSQIEHLKIKMNRERNATTKQHIKWDKEVQEQIAEQATQIDFLKDENRHMRTVLNENRELKKLLKKISNDNGEIWLDNGQIIRLKKIIKNTYKTQSKKHTKQNEHR